MHRSPSNQFSFNIRATTARGQSRIWDLWCLPAMVSLVVIGSSMGCLHKIPEVKYQHEVGTVHVAIQSVAPFESYVDELQPKFSLTSEAALAKALPVTQIREMQTLRSLVASLKIALPNITSTQSEEKSSDGTTTTGKISSSTTKSSGNVNDAPEPPATPGFTLAPFPIPTGMTADVDPMLQYRTAASLMQEVALLSSYVKDAAMRDGSAPYVARLLVTVLPNGQSRAYDVRSRIAFFAEKDGVDPAPLMTFGPKWFESDLTKSKISVDLWSGVEERFKQTGGVAPVQVVPLFVTDSIDSSMRSVSYEQDRKVGVGLSGSAGNAGISGGLNRSMSDQDRSEGRLNHGTQVIGQPAENVIEAHLGASTSDRSFALIARTYNLTVLLLVPTAAKLSSRETFFSRENLSRIILLSRIHFIADSSFINAKDGVKLLSYSTSERNAFLQDFWEKHSDSPSSPYPRALEKAFLELNFDRFQEAFPTPQATLDWPGFASEVARFGRTQGTFIIPPVHFKFLTDDEVEGQLLVDDGKSMSLTLVGGQHLARESTVEATLAWREKASTTDHPVTLRSSSASIAPNGQSVTLTFPSIAGLNLEAPPKEPGHQKDSILYARATYKPAIFNWTNKQTADTTWVANGKVRYILNEEETKDPAPITLSVKSPVVLANSDGAGELIVEIVDVKSVTKGSKSAALSLTGADLLSVTSLDGKRLPTDGPDFVASAGQRITLKLGNLVPGSTLQLQLRQKGKPVEGALAKVFVIDTKPKSLTSKP